MTDTPLSSADLNLLSDSIERNACSGQQIHKRVSTGDKLRSRIAELENALRKVQISYGVRGPDEHPTNAGGDAVPAPDCYCPFCVSTRALQG